MYVRRSPAPGPDRPQDFEDFAPGADLRFISASQDATGAISVGGGDTSLLGNCGINSASSDIRRPQVSWDGKLIAFSARTSASEPWRIYTVAPDGSGCAVEPTIDALPVDDSGAAVPTNGELIHNFDPAFAPDGTIVFTSTRGNTKNVTAFDYQGPQRAPADPSKLNANLYVLEGGKVRQLTFMLNQELLPTFKRNGQVLFIAEKRVPEFYQLADRRINIDGGDYHPLYGQRRSIGYDQVTDLVHLADKNFAAIFSDRGAVHGAGTVAIINRSIGPDTISDVPADYPVTPNAPDFGKTPFFQRAVHFPDPAATGHVAGGTQGAYRNISPLPNGQLLVSYAANVVDLTQFSGNFDVVILDPITGARTPLTGLSDPATDELWPVAVVGNYGKKVFRSSLATGVNGAGVIFPKDDGQPRVDRAQLTYLDVPVILSLAFQNTRSGRPMQMGDSFQFFESLPPEGVTDLNQSSPFITEDSYGRVYSRRRLIGTVPFLSDGSARVQIPGGVPFIIGVNTQLAGDSGLTLHLQREEGQFYPGEFTQLSFRREVFNGFCGGCHGSVSGQETDVAAHPDMISQASKAAANKAKPLDIVNATRGADEGPDFP